MRKRPEERFATSGDMKSALESALEALSDAPGHQDIAPEAREAARLLALSRCAILDTAPEEEFDDLTRLASVLCGTPFASLSFADGSRLWFKSRIGIEEPATPLEASLGARAIRDRDVFVVPDAAADPRFASEACGPGAPGVRFYAGAPLQTRDGHVLGAIAVMDREPRDLSREQIESLRALSRQTMALLELRRFKRERADRQTGPGTSRAHLPSPAEIKP
jgi:GAF domain-containing protein